MSSVIDPGFGSALEPPLFPVHRFSVAEYEELGRLGILTEDDNVELLEGLIVPKMTKHPPHDSTIDLLNYFLTKLLPLNWFVRIQNCIATSDSIPEPDLAVVRGRPGDHRETHPTGADVGLIVEVADSTVARDRAKAAIYARAGIPHYWIVNLDQKQIEIFAEPTSRGKASTYDFRAVHRGDELVALMLDGKRIGEIRASEIVH